MIAANDFVRWWSEVGEDALGAVDRVGSSGWLILGDEVAAFERALAEWWGARHVVGVASGLDAIEIALRCAGVTPGDRVITTPLTAFATTLAIVRAGAIPVWCDVDETGGLDLELALQAVVDDERIRAAVPVHLYGHPLEPAGLRALVDAGVTVIEDCAQSVGARRDGAPTGLIGAAAATSFYPTKNLGAMGDGGAVITDDDEIAAAARRMRDYGQTRRYEHTELGLNSRLDEVHAAILRSAVLPRLTAWTTRRAEIAERYESGLAATTLRPIRAGGGSSAHHLFPVEVCDGEPEAVQRALTQSEVGVSRHYPFVCPDQPAAAGRGTALDDLAVARRLAYAELSLPIHPFLSDAEVDAVIDACRGTSG